MPGAETSVVVVSYRPGNWLRSCLESVREQASEVIVVDNASPGGEASEIARACGARPVPTRQNLGFAGGVAVGLTEARGEVIALLNDDAIAGAHWLTAATRVLNDPAVAAVTPKVVLAGRFAEVRLEDETWFAPGDPRPLGRQLRSITVDGAEVLDRALGAGLHDLEQDEWRWTAGARPFYVPVLEGVSDPRIELDGEPVAAGPIVRILNHAGSFLRGHGIAGEYGFGAPDDGRFDRPAERFGFSGTAPVFRAETLRRLGPFATRFFAYNEDTDWCLRARLAGMRILYDPEATVTHRMSATSGGAAAARVRHLARRNAALCLVRNAPARVAWKEIETRLRAGRADPVRRDLIRLLPWAVGTRFALSRRWSERPADVWARWADQDLEWDRSPASG